MQKHDRHESIRERAREALQNLYHNATPRYPSLDDIETEIFNSWFYDAASDEIEYIRDGGAYGKGYRKTLQWSAERKYKSPAAQQRYVRKGMRAVFIERARCNRLDSRESLTNAHWERITEFGRLYQWGRGGRTLAPENLIRTHGGSSFSIREDYADDMPIGEVVDLIRVVESFNRYVDSWCRAVPEMWREYHDECDIRDVAELGSN